MGSSFTDINEQHEVKGSALTVSTLPGAARVALEFDVHEGDVLFDIAYDVWPSENAQRWTQSGGIAISGLSMLAAQALEQVRIFVTGTSTDRLPLEETVRHAMNAAVGLDETGLHSLSVG